MKDGLQRPKSQIKLHPLKAQDTGDKPIQCVQFLIVQKKINPGKQTLKQVLSNEMSELETRVKKFYKIL